MRPLRCLTLNLWGASAPVRERLAVVVQGLAELAPDVVGLQEVRTVRGSLPNQAETLARAAGYEHVYAVATPVADGEEGLAILAREPILEHACNELPHASPDERRILLSARIRRGDGGVWVHTTHLNYRLAHGKQREDQVQAIEAIVAPHGSDVPQVLMGDFNARPEADEIRWLRGQVTLGGRRTYFQDAWALLHPEEAGWTWASANPNTAKLPHLEPDRRLDYIFVTPMRRDGRGAVRSCQIVFRTPGAGDVYASDHYGLCAEIQIEAT